MFISKCLFPLFQNVYFLYFQLLTAVDPKFLKLTQMDDIIYVAFRNEFRDLKVDILVEEHLKNKDAKEVCR